LHGCCCVSFIVTAAVKLGDAAIDIQTAFFRRTFCNDGTGETPADTVDDRDLLVDWAVVTAVMDRADRRRPSSTDSWLGQSLYWRPLVD
jgi:hypothetical protein